MGDSAMTVVAIIVATVIMGVFPLMAMADHTDKTVNLTVQTATTEFVNDIRATGILTYDKYDAFSQTLVSTGNAYDISIEVQIADGNLSKKEGNSSEKIYYVKYHTQIMDELMANYETTGTGKITFKEGDIISVSVENANPTIAYELRNFMYKVTGKDSSTITAEATGMITRTGK